MCLKIAQTLIGMGFTTGDRPHSACVRTYAVVQEHTHTHTHTHTHSSVASFSVLGGTSPPNVPTEKKIM